jgi:hypothetical protein
MGSIYDNTRMPVEHGMDGNPATFAHTLANDNWWKAIFVESQ